MNSVIHENGTMALMNINDRIKKKAADEIEKRKEELFHLLSEIVRIPSVTGNEREAQDFVRELYESINLEVVSLYPNFEKLKDHVAFIDSNIPPEGRPNIIGIKRGKGNARSLILNGHIDVVSPDPIELWDYDPWGGNIVGKRLYGRGALDMKGGLIANFFALKCLVDLGFIPEGQVMLQSVIEEETGGGGGTLACLMEGYRGDGMICTEPHELKMVVAMSGISYFRVKVYGKSAHGGKAHEGVNAIGKMNKIYDALTCLDEERGRKVKFSLFEKGSGRSTHLNIGTLRAGTSPSIVPGIAEMECRISFIPGEKLEDIHQTIENLINETAQADPWMKDHPPQIEWYGWQTNPWFQDCHHPFIQQFKSVAEEVLSCPVELSGRAAGLDSRFSQYFNIPAFCFGPRGSSIHGVNEWVDLDSLVRTTQVLALFMITWCGFQE
jgi:acetylornithine deacetylase